LAAVLELQDEAFKTWFEKLLEELKEKFGEEYLEKLFVINYLPIQSPTASLENEKISTSFICEDSGRRFRLPKKKYVTDLLAEDEDLSGRVFSPYTGGLAIYINK
jgi:hypothetical protein